MNSPTGNPGDPAAEDVRTRIQRTLVKTFIALPLLNTMADADAATEFDVIIDANLDYPGARAAAREWILQTLAYLIGQSHQSARRLKPLKNKDQPHYVSARPPPADTPDLVALAGSSHATLHARLAPPPTPHPPPGILPTYKSLWCDYGTHHGSHAWVGVLQVWETKPFGAGAQRHLLQGFIFIGYGIHGIDGE